ncbi:MAG TPA: phosphatidylinositol-specific phospholipase C1-like protein [Candidatus Dormibacteraeota bacterium]|nr:phosphatidylinositol-specific phospholipase C1-like protein [Candidatus Dormibacteraeota bacterium]
MEKHLLRGVALAALALALGGRSASAILICDSDCDGDRQVSVDELIRGVGIALGSDTLASCPAADANGDSEVMIDDLVSGLGRALDGCPAAYPRDDTLRLNQMQVLGTHNSYHLQSPPALFQAVADFSEVIAETLEYSHLPLPEQFDTQGIRQIELDVFADPQGGLYAHPLGLAIVTGDPDLRIPELEAPGLKVLHVQDIDYYTTCQTFRECLGLVRAWSEAHPLHAPLMIQVEAKDDVLPSNIGFDFVVPLPFGPDAVDEIDYEIRSVFPPGELITPDDVRGAHATLREAIEQDGWPTLAEARGKVFFCLDNENSVKTFYLNGHPSLSGRVLFTSSAPPADEAGFVKLNDPIGDLARIQDLVGQGYIVRTRADADTVQARSGDTTMRDAAITSGAQFVSTDYPVPDPRFGTGYMVAIPGGMPARCNPISAPAACTAADIE